MGIYGYKPHEKWDLQQQEFEICGRVWGYHGFFQLHGCFGSSIAVVAGQTHRTGGNYRGVRKIISVAMANSSEGRPKCVHHWYSDGAP